MSYANLLPSISRMQTSILKLWTSSASGEILLLPFLVKFLTPFDSVALYGLLLFYSLTKDELIGRRPLSKFLSIKLIVMFTWYQSFVVCFLQTSITSLCIPCLVQRLEWPSNQR
jgi:hypothetical protein